MIDLARGGGESRVGESEIRIECNRLFIQFGGGLKILQQRVMPGLILARPQVKNVGVRVVGRFRFDARFFLRRKSSAQ